MTNSVAKQNDPTTGQALNAHPGAAAVIHVLNSPTDWPPGLAAGPPSGIRGGGMLAAPRVRIFSNISNSRRRASASHESPPKPVMACAGS